MPSPILRQRLLCPRPPVPVLSYLRLAHPRRQRTRTSSSRVAPLSRGGWVRRRRLRPATRMPRTGSHSRAGPPAVARPDTAGGQALRGGVFCGRSRGRGSYRDRLLSRGAGRPRTVTEDHSKSPGTAQEVTEEWLPSQPSRPAGVTTVTPMCGLQEVRKVRAASTHVVMEREGTGVVANPANPMSGDTASAVGDVGSGAITVLPTNPTRQTIAKTVLSGG